MDIQEVVERLKELRSALGGSAHRLAQEGEVARSSIYNWINGTNFPNFEALAAWCRNINLNANWLLTGKGPMFLAESADHPQTPAERIREEVQSYTADLEPLTQIVSAIEDTIGSITDEHRDGIERVNDSYDRDAADNIHKKAAKELYEIKARLKDSAPDTVKIICQATLQRYYGTGSGTTYITVREPPSPSKRTGTDPSSD